MGKPIPEHLNICNYSSMLCELAVITLQLLARKGGQARSRRASAQHGYLSRPEPFVKLRINSVEGFLHIKQ